MTYVAEWERLSDAATRVAAALGVSIADARSQLCQAISDRAVRIRCKLKRNVTRHMTSTEVLYGEAFDIPTTLTPEDFNWEDSSPIRPWLVRRGSYSLPGGWELRWVELSNVTNVLLRSEVHREPTARAVLPRQRRPKSQPERERVRRVLEKLFPEGLPDQSELPNHILCLRVGKMLTELKQPSVSKDTILRAAGRRS